MIRRNFLKSVASVSAASAVPVGTAVAATDELSALEFYSTSSLLAADGTALTDATKIPVWAEETAVTKDVDGNGDGFDYPDSTPIPLVADDGSHVGIGAPLVNDDATFREGNEEFLLNVWDEKLGGSGTVGWYDNGQHYGFSSYGTFTGYATDNGYTVEKETDLTAVSASNTDAVVIPSPKSVPQGELDAIGSFAANGGVVVLLDQGDYNDFDKTATLNDLASAIGAGFRFADNQVEDETNNAGGTHIPLTSNFNTEDFSYFGTRDGIGLDIDPTKSYDVTVTGITDGDTIDVEFDSGQTNEIRVLGIDTPEMSSQYERLQEWEGIGDDAPAGGGGDDGSRSISELNFYSTASLLDAAKEPLTDDSLVAVWAESTAYNEDTDGNGDAVSYPDGTDIPLVAVDDSAGVVGFGASLVNDGADLANGDEDEFVLNVWDEQLGGSGTVLWDEGHDQFGDYTLSNFSTFESNAESAGYTVESTTSIPLDTSNADAYVVSTPGGSFSDADKTALSNFVNDGGVVFLHDRSDYSDYDGTANLNEVAGALGAGFRFNDDQVLDDSNNAGSNFSILSTNFNETFSYFGSSSTTSSTTTSSTGEEYLLDWAQNATDFVKAELSVGDTVTISFDEKAKVFDPFGRLLAYVNYDESGDGSRNSVLNKRLVEEGLARVYDSSYSRHNEFWTAEAAARTNDTGLWQASNPDESPEIRNRSVEDLFFPSPTSVVPGSGGETVVWASSSATQSGGDRSVSGDIPLVAVDGDNRLAAVGGPLIDESYEQSEGFSTDTSTYENFAFTTNLVAALSNRTSGDILICGGQKQFNLSHAVSAEDAAYYMRYLEGQDIGFEQVNDLTADRLQNARALVLSTPKSSLSDAELSSVQQFAADGGAVILLASGAATDTQQAHLEDVATTLGSDLRLNRDAVTDSTNNVGGDSAIPTTTNFDTDHDLFGAYDGTASLADDTGGTDSALDLSLDQQPLPANGETTVTISLTEAPNGLAGFEIAATVSSADVATITDATNASAFELVETPAIDSTGTTVTFKVADTNDAVKSGATDVTLGTFTLSAVDTGSADLTVTAIQMDDDAGSPIAPADQTTSFDVSSLAAIGDNEIPTDPDGDGMYEDIDGDGAVTQEDVTTLFENKDDAAVTDAAELYDFNDNGRVDYADIVKLLEET